MLLKVAGLTRINLEAEAKGIDEETASGQPYHYESIEECKSWMFKIAILRIYNNYPKIDYSCLSTNYLPNTYSSCWKLLINNKNSF